VEATVAFFACAWLGAIAVPAFSGYGPDALASRLKDCRARVLITATGFQRRGTWINMSGVAQAAHSGFPDLEEVICVGLTGECAPARWRAWSDCLACGAKAPPVPPAALDPNHPLLLVYTSGTSGRPKGIVHSHAGFLVKVASDYALAFDIHPGDRVCWITDLGWLVGPQMIVGNAALGATAIYYVGALDVPDWDQLWRLCAAEQVNLAGVSPSAIRGMAAVRPEGPAQTLDLRGLRTFASTGETWDPAAWRWLFDRVGAGERPIVNYSGGTEIGGGILTSYATLPLQDCAFTGPVIGMDADIVYPAGEGGPDAVGELVIRNAWPGMTHSFWDREDEVYLDTYWRDYPGVWRHGDLAARDAEGWWYVRGRSDDTLKVAGRRVGPAEIENALLQAEGVMEAAVVGVPDAMKGQSIVAFVVARSDRILSASDLMQQVRDRLGASLVPSQIHTVAALPKTRNGKIVRRAILARYLGQPAGDLSTLESSEALMAIPLAEMAAKV
jgi:acetyl-CoA synthetase